MERKVLDSPSGSIVRVSYNHGQNSWDNFALLELFSHTPDEITTTSPAWYLQFLLSFNIVSGGEGEQHRVLKRIAGLFEVPISFKTQ